MAYTNMLDWGAAMEIEFENLSTNYFYSGKTYIPLPKGDIKGHGNALFFITPSQDHTIAELQTDYIRWYLNSYRFYTTDTRFMGKIGKKRLNLNMTSVMKRDWTTIKFPHPLKLMTPVQRSSQLRNKPNIIVDLGEWFKFYCEYSSKMSIPVIVKKGVEFIANKLNEANWHNYEKIIYIPINQWFMDRGTPLGFSKKDLNNPLAILLFAAYRYPNELQVLPNATWIFGDSTNRQYLVYHTEDFNKGMFPKFKQKLRQMRGFKWDETSEAQINTNFTEEEEDPESDINNARNEQAYDDPKKIVPEVPANAPAEDKAKAKLIAENRAALINDMKRGLMGNPVETPPSEASAVAKATPVGSKVASVYKQDDITTDPDVYDEEDLDAQLDDYTPVHLDDDDLDEEVEVIVDDELKALADEDPDALLNKNGDLSVAKIEKNVRRRLRSNYMPERDEKHMERIKALRDRQSTVITKKTTAAQIKSKRIETSSFANVVKTTNKAITESRFVNFDRDYNEKKLEGDIDNAIGKLADASVGVFVVGKEEEDTSTQLDYKRTVTYTLEDEWGGKHKLKLDIPIIYDDKYIFINGSKQLLEHQQIMMPIVKTNPTDVQVVTWYNKVIVRREGVNDTRTMAVRNYMSQHNNIFEIRVGNAMARNAEADLPSTLDIDMYARSYTSFRVGDTTFILDRASLMQYLDAHKIKYDPDCYEKNMIPVGYTGNKQVIYVEEHKTLTDLILDRMSDKDREKITKNTKKKIQKMLRTRIKIQEKFIPLILLLFFFEGFTTVMKKANINYTVVDKSESFDYDRSTHDAIECADKYIVYERDPIWNAMLMNGLSELDLSIYDFDELDDQDTFTNMLTNYFTSRNIANILMQYYDFMIDDLTKEILEDLELPTDFVELLLLANRMLADNSFTLINKASTFRIRSNEILAQYVYKVATSAYANFRATQGRMGRKRNPDRINAKQNAVINLITRESTLTNEASVLNPILELEKARMVTPRGPRGVGKERAMTLDKRAYDRSMLGIIGTSTSFDSKAGVARQLTLEPNITSTRGYVKEVNDEELEQLSGANMLTPSELLSPPGVLHDDGPRTSMAFKQTSYMLPIEGSSPVFFGNKVEEVIPYHMSREFVVTAKDDGKVVDIDNGIIVVQYKDGTYDSIDTTDKIKKNSSSGFFIKTHMESPLTKVGQKFVKNEVIGRDPRAFSQKGKAAAMNVGVPVKVAILPNYDIYEDASPITSKLSEKFTTHMSMQEKVGIPAQSYVEKIVKIGDTVEVGDPLIIYDPAHDDDETNAFINEVRDKLGEDLQALIDLQAMPQVRTEYAGTIVGIDIYTSVDPSELSPSLQKIFRELTKANTEKIKTLSKYSNNGDRNYFKCGQLITNAPEVVKPDYQNKVKGVTIGNDGRGVAIFFYIEFKDIAKTGDKGSAFTALKFTTSHVIPKGYEPYSQYRPDEEISAILAPGAVLARKVPSILETMFANKLIVEMKRHALQIFFDDEMPNT